LCNADRKSVFFPHLKGDFAGVASLYTDDATAFPPGSGMVKGRAAIGAMWKSPAEQAGDPKVTTLDVKPLGGSAPPRPSHLAIACAKPKSWNHGRTAG
jgi:hypothetical protein